MYGLKMKFLLGWPIFRCYVSFRECSVLLGYGRKNHPFFFIQWTERGGFFGWRTKNPVKSHGGLGIFEFTLPGTPSVLFLLGNFTPKLYCLKMGHLAFQVFVFSVGFFYMKRTDLGKMIEVLCSEIFLQPRYSNTGTSTDSPSIFKHLGQARLVWRLKHATHYLGRCRILLFEFIKYR